MAEIARLSRERRPIAGAGLVVIVIALVACGDSASPVEDAGAADAASADAALPELEWPELSVGTTVDPNDPTRIGSDAMPADLSCLGVWDWPAPGPDTTSDLELWRNGNRDDLIPNQCFRVYPDNVVGDATPCSPTDPRTDEAGRGSVTVRGDAPFAARVFGNDAPLAADRTRPTILHDGRLSLRGRALGASASVLQAPVVGESGLALLPLLTGRPIVPRVALVIAFLFDCAQRPLYGARLRLVLADGTDVTGPNDDSPSAYFGAAGPLDPDQDWTHVNGIAAAVTRPIEDARDDDVLVEITGRPPGETVPRVVGCARAVVEPDTLTVVSIEPLRAAGPSCPGMSRGQ